MVTSARTEARRPERATSGAYMLGMQLKTVPRERREDQEDDKHSDTARRPLFWGPSWACPARAENFGLGDSHSLLNDAQNGTHVDGKNGVGRRI